ncbi:MAG: hypothetical protein ACJAS1_006366 [Oleiphilaceae bacterium]|jgi:hypothetical protein
MIYFPEIYQQLKVINNQVESVEEGMPELYTSNDIHTIRTAMIKIVDALDEECESALELSNNLIRKLDGWDTMSRDIFIENGIYHGISDLEEEINSLDE